MVNSKLLFLCILSLFLANFSTARECTRRSSLHVAIECRIAPQGSSCFRHDEGDTQINTCDNRTSCLVWTGADVSISCAPPDEDSTAADSLSLYRENSTQSLANALWPFAESLGVEGAYECRFSNGSVFSRRSINFDEGVYVIPGSSPYAQSCHRDIVPHSMPGYDCNVAQGLQRYFAGGAHSLFYNVLGPRPITVDIGVVWDNHYPVDLHLVYNTEACNSTTTHNVTVDTKDLVFVGTNSVHAYVVITAYNSVHSSTMCVLHNFFGAARLFANDSLPKNVLAVVGESAQFQCEARTLYTSTDEKSATISILIRSPESHISAATECFNCSLTATEISPCTASGNCFNLKVSTSLIETEPLMPSLTASWEKVDSKLNGSEVVCALAVDGITQWVNSASISVYSTPTSVSKIISVSSTTPSVTPTLNKVNSEPNSNTGEHSGLTSGTIAGITVGAVVIMISTVSIVVCVAGVALFIQRRNSFSRKRLPSNTDGEL